MPAQHDRADEHVGKCETGAYVERVELNSVLDERNRRLEANVCAKQLVVGYQFNQDHVSGGGKTSTVMTDRVAVVVFDSVSGIDPDDVADIQAGRCLRPA